MTSPNGLWEHALYSEPRVDHGFCTDDNARAMILLNGERELTPTLSEASRIYVRFVRDAALPAGGFHNRRRADGSWADSVGSDDSQGRAIWALGSMVHFGSQSSIRDMGMELFLRQNFVSPSPRANAFAVLGASEVLAANPTHEHARNRMQEWIAHIRVPEDSQWPWPESRLAYDNARIPEALIAAGVALGIDSMIRDGLRLLDWLVGSETMDGHFSFTPAGGWAPGESRPGFDQQPVEAAAFADACDRAWEITGDSKWRDHVLRAGRWFVGNNDRQVVLYDHETGAGYDGLTQGGANLNQGAESTLAALSTLQKAARYS